MKKGIALMQEVFREEEDVELYEVEDIPGVTDYTDDIAYNEGWYNHHEVRFCYKGETYQFFYRSHTSDNVCDTKYDINSFVRLPKKLEYTFAVDENCSADEIAKQIKQFIVTNNQNRWNVTLTEA